MFKVNDYIIYGGYNVCKVVDIGVPDINMEDKERQYYTLQPIYEKGSTIYTPIDNNKVVMRNVILEKEANELINNIPSIELLEVEDDNTLHERYKEAMTKYDCKELIRIIKTSYLRKEDRLLKGKKSTITDDKYLKMAEDYLFGELAFSLNMTKEEVKEYIMQQVSQIEESKKEIS